MGVDVFQGDFVFFGRFYHLFLIGLVLVLFSSFGLVSEFVSFGFENLELLSALHQVFNY